MTKLQAFKQWWVGCAEAELQRRKPKREGVSFYHVVHINYCGPARFKQLCSTVQATWPLLQVEHRVVKRRPYVSAWGVYSVQIHGNKADVDRASKVLLAAFPPAGSRTCVNKALDLLDTYEDALGTTRS